MTAEKLFLQSFGCKRTQRLVAKNNFPDREKFLRALPHPNPLPLGEGTTIERKEIFRWCPDLISWSAAVSRFAISRRACEFRHAAAGRSDTAALRQFQPGVRVCSRA